MPSVVRVRTTPDISAAPGVAYSAAGYLRAVSTTRNGRVNIVWFDASHVFISRASGGWESVTSGAWVGADLIGSVAPGGTAFLALEVEFDANFGEEFYADQLIVAEGDNPTWSAGGFSAETEYIVERSVESGDWEEINGAGRDDPAEVDDESPTAEVTIYDREMPLRVGVRYRAYARTGVAPNRAVSAAAVSAEDSVDATQWWLRDPSDSTRDIAVSQMSMNIATGPGSTGTVFLPEGRELPVVVHGDQPTGDVFDLRIRSMYRATFDAVMLMLLSKRRLFVHNTLGDRWYIKVTGDIEKEQVLAAPTPEDPYPTRHLHQISCQVTEVAEG